MNADPRVILIEFNELTPQLMKQFMDAGLLPNFRRFHDESTVYVTDAEEEGEKLNPWVQWVTVHSGLRAAEHGIYRLSDGCRLDVPAIWDVLSDAGYRVWVCGSMNARYDRPLNGHLIPDPWSTGLTPFPRDEFAAFASFIRDAVQEHTNPDDALGKHGLSSFIRYMVGHGLSWRTMCAIGKQLCSERFSNCRWKRATLMELLQFDVFRHYFRKRDPHFSTFFANSTAHFQHKYWRHMEPERFDITPEAAELRDYGRAIQFGYQCMDRLIARFLKLAGKNTTLIFATALGQQPYLRAEKTGGKRHFRVRAPESFRKHFGVPAEFEYTPVMAEEFYLRFNSAADAREASDAMRRFRINDAQLQIDDEPLFKTDVRGNDVFALVQYHGKVSPDAVITSVADGSRIRFFDAFYQMDGLKSGFHHPHGMLWIRQPERKHRVVEEKLPLHKVASMVLRMYGLQPFPPHETAPMRPTRLHSGR